MDGIRCLQLLASNEGPIGARELARQLNMETTRAHRLLKTLAHMGMARQNRNSKYMPGPAMQVMASQSMYTSGLMNNARGPLLELNKKTGLTAAFGMLWERNVYYLYHLIPGCTAEETVNRMRLQPVTESAIGMMLLSKKTDDEVRAFYEGADHIPSYPEGVEKVIFDLQHVRKDNYARLRIKKEEGRYSLALMTPNNLYTSVALAGDISKDQVPELSEEIRTTLEKIFPEAP